MAAPIIGAIISRIGARAMLTGARVAARVGAKKTAANLMSRRAATISAQYAQQAASKIKPPPLPGAQPAAPAPKSGLLQRLLERMDRNLSRNTPIADQVKDLSMSQRVQRLQQMGDLVSKTDAARKLGTPNPSTEQIVGMSEDQQEQRRQEQIAERQGAGGVLSKKMLFAGGVLGPIVVPQLPRAMQKFAEHLMDANREFAQLTPALAGMFARMERQDLHLAARTGAATAGGATKLGEAIMQLKEDTQPIREVMVRLSNTIGIVFVKAANLIVKVIEMSGFLKMIEKLIELAEWIMNIDEDAIQEGRPWDVMFEKILAGDFNKPQNNAPVAPGGA